MIKREQIILNKQLSIPIMNKLNLQLICCKSFIYLLIAGILEITQLTIIYYLCFFAL